jgi:Rps23 Pro-64 3,4-dihydroxylase Tpa1-like proline 4-hydroxylase
MQYLNDNLFEPGRVQKYADEFVTNKPYPHIVIDDFLKPEIAQQAYEKFPPYDLFKRKYKGLNEKKAEGSNLEDFDPLYRAICNELASPEMYKWIQKVTHINEEVLMTDDAVGRGLHQGGPGSFLDVHIDFNIHAKNNMHRRLNILIYLNKNWKEEYGGGLEMWNSDVSKMEKCVLPMFNRCLIFETNEISYHGYGRINIPEGETRKSIYGYYYTHERANAVPYHDTVFKARPEEGKLKQVQTDAKELAKNTVKRVLKKIGITFE